MKFIFGKKIQMSQVFAADGTLVPVTIVSALPCVVTQVKQQPHDRTTALQVGFKEGKAKHIAKPQLGHLKNLPSLRMVREMRMDATEIEGIERGDMITVETFAVGDVVDVVGTSKGRGFQGVVKRHHFRGGPASHGHKDNLRMPGSIGAGGVQRVFKGMRMGGHMGDEEVTVKHLKIVGVDAEKNLLQVKGAVPGGRNGLILIKGLGALKVTKGKKEAPVSEPVSMPETVAATAVETAVNTSHDASTVQDAVTISESAT